MKKTERHKPTGMDLVVLIPFGIFGILFICFFLLMSVWITYQLIDWSMHVHSQLRSKDHIVIAIALMLCIGFVIFCGAWLLRTLRWILQRTGVLGTETYVPSRSEVANVIDLFVLKPSLLSNEIELMAHHTFEDDPLLQNVQSTLREILTEYQGADGNRLQPNHIKRLKELSRELRER